MIDPIPGFTVETDREEDARWIAEVVELPGVLVYGATRDDAIRRAWALVAEVVADRAEHGEGTERRG